MTDLLTKYRRATGREARLRIEADQAATERSKTLSEMHSGGMSYAKIAEATGLSRSRVQQLVERSPSRATGSASKVNVR